MPLRTGALNSGKGMRSSDNRAVSPAIVERFSAFGADVPRNQSMDLNMVEKKCGMNIWNVVSGDNVAFIKLTPGLNLALGRSQPEAHLPDCHHQRSVVVPKFPVK